MTPTRLPPPYPLDLDEIEAKAYLAGRADGEADVHERIDVMNALPLPPSQRQAHPAQRMITQQQSLPQHPPLFRRATLPAAVPHTTDDLRTLLEEDRRALPLPVSRPGLGQVRPKVLNHRPSIRHIRPNDAGLAYDSLEWQRELERQRDLVESLDRFRLQDDMVRRRDEDRYYDDIALERRRRDLDVEDEMRMRAAEVAIERERERDAATRGHFRRGREEDVTYGGGDYDGERERNPFAPVSPHLGRRATVAYGYRG